MANKKDKKGHLFCPYCDAEITGAKMPFCQPCEVTVFYCPKCHKSFSRDKKVCPHCGAEIRG